MYKLLEQHKQFNSKQELNEVVEHHIERCNYQLNETDRKVLWMLSQYAVKYYGVAHLKIKTIANKVEKSERTIQRSIKKLEVLQVIKRKSVYRKIRGGHAANLFIFLPMNDAASVSPCESYEELYVSTDEHIKSENEPITNKSTIIKDLKTYPEESFDELTPFQKMKKTIGAFTTEKNLASKLYGVYLAQTNALRKTAYTHDDLIDIAVKSIKIAFLSTKSKKINNIAGFYHGVLNNKLNDLYYEFVESMEVVDIYA